MSVKMEVTDIKNRFFSKFVLADYIKENIFRINEQEHLHTNLHS